MDSIEFSEAGIDRTKVEMDNKDAHISGIVENEELMYALSDYIDDDFDLFSDLIAKKVMKRMEDYYDSHEEVAESQMIAFKEMLDRIMG